MKTKKQFFFMRAAMSLLMMLCSLGAWADDSGSCGTNVTYSYVESTHTLTISGTGAMEDYDDSYTPWYSICEEITTVVIGAGVTSIGNYAFSGCSGLTSVTIPASVTSIGECAFGGSGLTCVTIPASVTSIGESAFFFCSNLATVAVYAPSCTLGYDAFAYCDNLTNIYVFSDLVDDYKAAWSAYANKITGMTPVASGTCGKETPEDVTWRLEGEAGHYGLFISGTGEMADYVYSSRPWTDYANGIKTVVIGSGVTSIGDNAFSGCSGLTSIEIPSNVTSIGTRAFFGCSGLTSIEIPANVTSIGQSAFYGCSGLTSVTIPAGVTSIGDYVFNDCSNLATITVETSNTVYNSRNGCNAIIETSSNKLIAGCKNTTIPASVTSIGDDAFGYCSALTSIEIPASVTSIGDYAFFYCSGLTSVEIPASVTSIGDYAFDGCSGLATVTVYAPSCTLGDEAFSACSNLKNIYVFSDLVDDYKAAWSAYANKITAMTPVASGTCGKETPEDVTWRLEGFTNNYALFISGTGEMADYGYSSQPWNTNTEYIKTVLIENGVTSIGECAFCGCNGLTSISIPASVTSIGAEAFNGCSNLTTVSIPASVTSIGNYAFGYCSALTSIEIPASVTSIGEEAFNNTALTSIEIPASVTSIGNGAFNDCEKLTSITVAEGNANYSNDTNGVLFNKDKTTLIKYPKGNNADLYEIPDNVTSICEKAFAGCEDLETVTLPDDVTSIGDEAFRGCGGLISVTIPASVTSIGNSAFVECSSLTTVNIPANVTSIGGQAFSGCYNLASVTLNSNPTIGGNAFFHNTTVTMNLAAAEVDGAKWTTFYNNGYNFQADENTEVYKGAVSGSELVLTAISDKIVNAGNAVILKSTDNPVMTLKADNSTGDYSDNELKGLSVRTLASDVKTTYGTSTIYVMGNKSNKFGFHKYTGAYMPANKAFLALGSGSSAPLRMVIDDDEETTGVASMADGIDNMSDEWYTLDGRKLNSKPTTKGMYIVNGKKVMIK